MQHIEKKDQKTTQEDKVRQEQHELHRCHVQGKCICKQRVCGHLNITQQCKTDYRTQQSNASCAQNNYTYDKSQGRDITVRLEFRRKRTESTTLSLSITLPVKLGSTRLLTESNITYSKMKQMKPFNPFTGVCVGGGQGVVVASFPLLLLRSCAALLRKWIELSS